MCLFLVFKVTSILFSIVAVPVYMEGSLFSTSSSVLIVCRLFDDGHSDWCEVKPHCSFLLNKTTKKNYCSFNIHFSNNEMLTIFSCAFWPSICLLWRMSVLIFCPFFDWAVYLFIFGIELHELFVYF